MTGAKDTVELGSFGGKEVGLYYCTVKESCGSRALRAEYMYWQVEELGWALRGRQLLGLSVSAKACPGDKRQETLLPKWVLWRKLLIM